MDQNLKESKSLKYLLKQWFNKTIDYQNSFLKYYQSIQKKSQDEIVLYASELQKYLGKVKTRQCEEFRKKIILSISSLDFEIFELSEFLQSYKSHLDKPQEYKVNFPTLNRIKEHVRNNIETVNSLNVLQNNLAKSANVIFVTGKRSKKRNEVMFEDFMKKHVNLLRRIIRENNIFIEEFKQIITVLEKEIEIVVEKAEPKVAATTH